MDLAAGAHTLIFFVCCIAQVIVGSVVFSYAAHSFLTIVVDTAAGSDHVVWPAEPFTDWLWKPWYLAWLVACWLTPPVLVLALFKLKALQIVLVTAILFWFLFPLGLLSSLSASSKLVIFRPLMAWWMLRHWAATAAFYVATELVLAAVGAAVYMTLRQPDRMLLVPVLPIAMAAALFLYGRLVGRLAWVMNQRKLGRLEEAEALAEEAKVVDPWSGWPVRAPDTEAAGPESPKRAPKAVEDPWAVPPPEEDPDYWKKGLPLDVQTAGSYGIQTGSPPPAPTPPAGKKKQRTPATYAALPAETVQNEVEPMLFAEVPEKERKLVERDPEPEAPAWPMFNGVYSFLGYPDTVGPLFSVALGLWVMAAILRFQLSFFRL